MTTALLKTGLAWLVGILGALAVLVRAATDPASLQAAPWAVTLLIAGAGGAAFLGPRGAGAWPRVAGIFGVAGLLTAPPVVGVGIVLVAGGISAPSVAGARRSGPEAFAALALAAWATAWGLSRISASAAGPAAGLDRALLAAAAFHGLALLATGFLDAGALPRRPLRGWALDVAAGVVAWHWWQAAHRESVVATVSLTAGLVLFGWVLGRWNLLRIRLADLKEELAARSVELETLHSVSLEMLASLEQERICAIVDRECRKLFLVDFTFLALTERDGNSLSVVFHRSDGEADTSVRPLGAGLATAVARERQGRKIDDLSAEDESLRAHWVGPGAASALVVPLLVEDRVVGVLSVQCRRPAAYDDHALAVLTTIAQQAATAIENARHYRAANIDSLTGFFQRDYFFRRVEEEHRRARRYGGRFALLMIDLDGFKAVNDEHGHLAGDRYLEAIAHTVRAELRGADLACRYGGDEFCLLLPETSFSGGQVIAERIREAIAAALVDADGVNVRSTASIGLAAFPDHDAGDVNALLRNADEALYRAKRDGRNCVKSFAA